MIFKYYFKTEIDEVTLVADINPGPAHAVDILFGIAPRNQYAHSFKGALYFQANDGQLGAELWRTTGDSVELVADFEPGPAGSAPHAFAIYQNALYFAATTTQTGEELFRYDGTSVSLAADIDPGPDGGTMGGLRVYNGELYFTRQGPALPPKTRVWKFDGTSASPVAAINQMVDQIQGFAKFEGNVRTFEVFDGQLFFILNSALTPHYQLWAYDGVNAQKIADLTPKDDYVSRSFDLGVFKGALYFGVSVKKPPPWLGLQDELWSYDGQSPPKKIGVLATGGYSPPEHFQVFKNWLYFTGGGRLYRYDGTSLQDLYASFPGFPPTQGNLSLYATKGARVADLLFLSAYPAYPTGVSFSAEPYFFDGLQASMIENIMPDNVQFPLDPGSYPTSAVQVGDRLYFFAEDAEHGYELWSLRAEKELDIYGVLVPIWEDKLKWPVRPGVDHIVLGIYLVEAGKTPRLVARKTFHLPAKPERLEVHALKIDRGRDETPDAFGLLSVVFDQKTGEKVDLGLEVFGGPTNDVLTEIEQTAAAHGEEVQIKRMMSAPVQGLDRAQGQEI